MITFVAKIGTASSADTSVLATLDQTGTDDDSSKYIQLSAGSSPTFSAVFVFRLMHSASLTVDTVTDVTFKLNTIGLSWTEQRRVIEVKNLVSNRWETLGTNRGTESWVWTEQTFHLQNDAGFPNYFDSIGRIRIRIRSRNDADVANIDYVVCEVSDGNIVAPTDAPVVRITPSPTNMPSATPTAFPTNAPTAEKALVTGPTTETLDIISFVTKIGIASSEDTTVLETLDQSGTDDDSSKYIQLSAGSSTTFSAVFVFRLTRSASLTVDTVTDVKFIINTIGLSWKEQRRVIEVKNLVSNNWETLGTNRDTESWVWTEQTFHLQNDAGFPDYFDSIGRIRIRIRSRNDADVTNIDYVACEVTGGNIVAPTDSPTIRITPSPTDMPSVIPTVATSAPTMENPTVLPTGTLSSSPSIHPSSSPSISPSTSPTYHPSDYPTNLPSFPPSTTLSTAPSLLSSSLPSLSPSTAPSIHITVAPSAEATLNLTGTSISSQNSSVSLHSIFSHPVYEAGKLHSEL